MAFSTTDWALTHDDLKPTTQIVLAKLARYRNHKTGQCNPSQKTLAAACNMSVSTLNVHLRILESENLIRRTRQFDSRSGAARSTKYEFPEAPQVLRPRDRKSSQ